MLFTSASSRRTLVRAAVALGAALAVGGAAAQSGKTVKLLVGFPAGGGTDAIARILAEHLKDELGGPVIVENKPGAGGQLAAQALMAAAPDGATYFLSHDHTISILPQVVKTPGFDPGKDFAPAGGFATFVNAFAVSGANPAKSFNDYVGWVKGQGSKGAVGIPAPASVPEFLVKVIGEKYKLDLVAAPYRGSAPMMADMLGNQIGAGIASVPDFIENHRAGKVRIVAAIGAKRQALLPQVPTFGELGFANLDDLPYYGIFAPVGTQQPFIERFGAALAKVLALPDVRQKLTAMGLAVGYEPQGQFAGRVRTYTQSWQRIIQANGFRPA